MPIDVICPNCQSRYRISDQFAGRAATCKKCGRLIPVPGVAREAQPDVDVFGNLQEPVPVYEPVLERFEPAAPARSRVAVDQILIFSDNATRLISQILVVVMILGLIWAMNAITGKLAERWLLPAGLQSKLRLAMILECVLALVIFAAAHVPAILFSAMQACSWTRSDFPESGFIRAAGAGSLPYLIFILMVKLFFAGDAGSMVLLALFSPVILIVGLRITMGIRWRAVLVTAALLLVVMPAVGWCIKLVNPFIQTGIKQIAGITPEAMRQYAGEHPEEVNEARAQAETRRQEALKQDPLYGKAEDLIARLEQARQSSSDQTKEQIKAALDPLDDELKAMRQTGASALYNRANSLVRDLRDQMIHAPSENIKGNLYAPITQALPISASSGDSLQEVDYRFRDLVINPVKEMRVDLRAAPESDKVLRWKRNGESEYAIELAYQPLGDEKQQRPWVAAAPIIFQRAKEQNLLAVPGSDQSRVTSGLLNGIAWTRIDDPARVPSDQTPGNDSFPTRRCTYVGRLATAWVVVTVFQHDPATGISAAALADRFVQGVRLAGAADTSRSPFDPALVVQEYLYPAHDDPARLLRNAGDQGVAALQEFLRKNPNNVYADRLLKELTKPPEPAASIATPTIPRTLPAPKAPEVVNVDTALKQLSTGTVFQRRDALKQLAEMQPDESKRNAVAEALESLMLSKESFSEAEAIGDALEVWWRPQTVVMLVPLLDENADTWRLKPAIGVLAATKDKRAVFPILRWLIKEPETVVAALKSMGPVAEDDIMKLSLLRDKNPAVRRNAARILEEIGTQKCLIDLRRASKDPRDPAAALVAQQALETVQTRVKEQKLAASQPASRPSAR